MDPKSREWQVWCALDKFSTTRDRKLIEGLTIDDIKKTLSRSNSSDRGKANAYIAGEELIREMESRSTNMLEKNRVEKKVEWFKNHKWWSVVIVIGIIIVAIGFVTDSLDNIFSFASKYLVSRKAAVQSTEGVEQKPLLLAVLLREYRQNIKILKDITYDQQYMKGEMGAQLWGMEFKAYEATVSEGAIKDLSLLDNLRKVYTGVFRIADNAIKETRNANQATQIRLYELIAQNFVNNQDLLKDALSQLKQLVGEEKFETQINFGSNVASSDALIPSGTVYKAVLPKDESEENTDQKKSEQHTVISYGQNGGQTAHTINE